MSPRAVEMPARRITPLTPKDDRGAMLLMLLQMLAEQRTQPVAQIAPPSLWLTLREASMRSGLSMVFLRRLIADGRLVGIRDGRSIKIRRVDLDNLDNLSGLSESSARLVSAAADLRSAVKARRR